MHLVQPGKQEAEYKPDLSYLHSISYCIYMNIPKERRVKSAKLDPYTEEGYLVRFEGSRIYRVYLLGRSRKVVRTSYCIFDESVSNLTQEEQEEVSNTLTDTVEDTGLD
jgi:ABC-type dipeptide/oligopeptide/nickel transport system ATPase subunit